MQIIEYPVEIRLSYPLDRLGEPSGLLFFDIETTGFSAFSSALYLIGAVYLKDGSQEKDSTHGVSCYQDSKVRKNGGKNKAGNPVRGLLP